jgi:hypothetical protein
MSIQRTTLTLCCAFAISVALAACGGGGGGDSAAPSSTAATGVGATPSPIASPSPGASPAPSPAANPSPSPSPNPSPSPSPGATPTPSPSPTPGVTPPPVPTTAKMRFFHASSCNGPQTASINGVSLANQASYNKLNAAVTLTPGNASLAITNQINDNSFAARSINLVAGNTYTAVSMNYIDRGIAGDSLISEETPFTDNSLFRARLINTMNSAVDVYLTTSQDVLPVVPSLTASLRSRGNQLIQPPGNYRLVVTAKDDASVVHFDSKVADMITAGGDDLTIIVPPLDLCAGSATNRVQVLNAKDGATDKTVFKDEVMLETLSVSPNSTSGAQFVLFSGSVSVEAGQTANILSPVPASQVINMVCPSNATKPFQFGMKGRRYAIEGTCIYINNGQSADSAEGSANDLGDYGL